MDAASDTRARKAALRRSTRAARRSLDVAARVAASGTIAERLLALPELARVRVVALYAALDEETDVTAVVPPLHARGVRTLFPRVRDAQLDLVEIRDAAALRPGFRGIREPVGAPTDPAVVDAVVLPGTAFDPHGGRLGQGGGHYDRLLSGFPEETVRIGVCFACQVVPYVPREPHDLLVDVVVTDHAVHRPGHHRGDPIDA